jgi:hypothetical protein
MTPPATSSDPVQPDSGDPLASPGCVDVLVRGGGPPGDPHRCDPPGDLPSGPPFTGARRRDAGAPPPFRAGRQPHDDSAPRAGDAGRGSAERHRRRGTGGPDM